MNTLLRNASTIRLSRRKSGHGLYKPLDQVDHSTTITDDDKYKKISRSRRRVVSYVHRDFYNKESSNYYSVRNYKRERAKKRLIFLQSYKLGSSDSEKLFKSRKLKKVAIKVQSVAVSFVSFMRRSSLRSCKSGLAITAVFSPTRIC